MERVVIGITGHVGAGKDEVALYLKRTGFTYISLSDFLRKISGSDDRVILEDLGDKLRKKKGNRILAVLAGREIEKSDSRLFVINSIRHPDEIRYLWKKFGAEIIGVTTSFERMFEFSKERGRPGEPETFEKFMEMQRREMGNEGSNVMQVHKCLEMAGRVIRNDGQIEELIENTEIALLELGIGIKRVREERSC